MQIHCNYEICASWINDNNKHNISHDKKFLKLAINILLDQYFFNFSSLTFRQIIGILIVSDPALFMANLFLFISEFKWMLQNKKWILQKVRKLIISLRFIDNLCPIKDNSEFEKNFKETDPPELVLKNTSNVTTWFTDLDINIKKNTTRTFYAAVGSEILHFSTTTYPWEKF